MSSFEKFKERLPSNENFYSSLMAKTISNKDYDHAVKVWNAIEMKAMKDFYNLYLKYDVLLLAYVFEKFRNSRFKNYGRCPSHYLSEPAVGI